MRTARRAKPRLQEPGQDGAGRSRAGRRIQASRTARSRHRAANGKPWLFPDDPGIVAIVTDAKIETRLPVVHLDDVDAVAALIKRSAISIEDLFSKRPRE
jgi:hypothetical protein